MSCSASSAVASNVPPSCKRGGGTQTASDRTQTPERSHTPERPSPPTSSTMLARRGCRGTRVSDSGGGGVLGGGGGGDASAAAGPGDRTTKAATLNQRRL